jgi:hypothetical protein
LDGAPLKLERAYLCCPLPVNDFAEGTVGGAKLPAAYGKEFLGLGDKSRIEIASKGGEK